MNWLRFLMKRKILVGLLVTFILMIGSYSIFKLDKELFPDINFGGAFAEIIAGDLPANEVEKSISIPLEQQLLSIDGVKDVQSTSLEGRSSIAIMTEEGKIDDIYPDIESIINSEAVNNRFIQDVIVGEISTSQPYEFYMDISGDDIEELTDFAKYVLEPRLESLPEVRDVAFEGLYEQEVVISFDRDKLQEHGVDLQLAIGAIQEANTNQQLGAFVDEEDSPTLRWSSTIEQVDDLKNIKVSGANGLLSLEDLATVEVAPSEKAAMVWKNGSKDFILVQIGRTSNTTQIEMADAVNKEVANIREEGFINNFELNYIVSQAEYVEDAIDGITSNIIIGGVLALVVLFLFLRNFRATFIIGLSIPTSILLTFTTMWLLDYSINMLALIGLGLGIGMLVDSSIVILESIYSKREQGFGKLEAVIEGTKEVATAVIASMLTTIVVFLPIGLLGGEVGQFMIVLSLVVAITLISSVIVAFTLIPTLSENFLKIKEKKKHTQEGLIKKKYGEIVEWVTKKRRNSLAVIGIFIVMFVASLFLITKIPSNIMPDVMNRYNEIMIELEPGVTIDEKSEIAVAISDKLQDVQDVETSFVIDNGLYFFALINMTKGDDITREQSEVNDDIFKSLQELQDDYPIGSFMSSVNVSAGLPVQVTIKGEELDQLTKISNEFMQELEKVDGILEAKTTVDRTSIEEVIQLNREKIESAGLTEGQIKQFIEQAFLQLDIGMMKVDDVNVPIKVKWSENISTQNALLDLKVPAIQGEEPLSNFISFEQKEVPNEINRSNGERFVTVTAEYEGTDLGAINREVQRLIKDFETPNGYQVELAGDLEAQQELMTEMLMILGISIFLVYLVMAVQFNHLFHPIIVMSVIPMTIVGVLIGLFVTQSELSAFSGMGIIMLIGIVLNNAILLLDRTKQLRLQGFTVSEALVEAGKNRIRPIFMTTLTTAFGMLPLAIASGSSGNYQAPLAIVIISGLLFATLITLLLIPAVYRLFTSKKAELKQLQKIEEEKAIS
ncbi:efflux RND transporter permease subunit [Bacillaceae bacterium W0354]